MGRAWSKSHAKWIDEATAHTPAGACRAMDQVRAGIDRLDRESVALLAGRAGYIRQAARLKGRRQEIVDPARIEEVVTRVRALAAVCRPSWWNRCTAS